MTTKLTRVGVLAVTGALLTTLAACSSDNSNGGSTDGAADPTTSSDNGDNGSGEEATIRFSWWGSDTRATLQQEAIDVCVAEIPGLKVEAENANWDSYVTKLPTQAAADDLPDVFTYIDPFMYDYIDSGRLTDLSQLEGIDLSEFPDDTFADVLGPNGEKFGVSMGVSGHGILLNQEVFAEYGVELPDETTWTWDDFERIAGEIAENSGGEVAGWFPELTEQVANAWARQHNTPFGEVDGAATGITVETMTDYWTMVKRMVDAGSITDPAAAQEYQAAGSPAEQGAVATGQAGMQMISMNQLGQWEATAGHELTPVLWPGETQFSDRGGWTKQGTFIGIAESSPNKEKAAEFVNCIINNSEVAKIMGLDRGVPANTRLAEELSAELEGADARFADWTIRSQEVNTQPFIRLNGGVGAVMMQEFQSANESVLFGTATPEEAAETFVGALEAAAD